MSQPVQADDQALGQVRVLIVDDHDLFRSGLRNLLEDEGVHVVGEAAAGQEALTIVREVAANLVHGRYASEQIALPALVSTLAICIVFLPVFALSGPAAALFRPLAMTKTFFDLPRPCGSKTVLRTCWSLWRGSIPSRKCISTVSSNLA